MALHDDIESRYQNLNVVHEPTTVTVREKKVVVVFRPGLTISSQHVRQLVRDRQTCELCEATEIPVILSCAWHDLKAALLL